VGWKIIKKTNVMSSTICEFDISLCTQWRHENVQERRNDPVWLCTFCV